MPEPTDSPHGEHHEWAGFSKVAQVMAQGADADAIHHALAQIAKVQTHNDDVLHRPLEIRTGTRGLRSGDLATYERNGFGNNGITVRPGISFAAAAFATVEELGHHLDHALGGFDFASRGDGVASVMKAIDKTPGAKSLNIDVRAARGKNDKISSRFRYLAYPEEKFARAYSQYIAYKSGDSALLFRLDFERRKPFGKGAYHSEADFAPVAAAFDKLFAQIGLAMHR
jgi:hypothetical protein